MYWEIYDRARNIRGQRNPEFVTIWTGRDNDGGRRWLVGAKPDSTSASGAIYSQQGSPSYDDSQTLADALSLYKSQG